MTTILGLCRQNNSMNTEQFDACVQGMKKTLETLLFETLENDAIRKAWLHMQQEFIKQNAIFLIQKNNHYTTLLLLNFSTQLISDTDMQTKPNRKVVPKRMIQISKEDILHISLLAESKGEAAYTCYHEIGECAYYFPTYVLNDFSLQKCISEITASDVYGDLLASTVSPLTPKQQLELIDQKDFTKYHRKYTKKDAYFIREFILSQGFSVYDYDKRIHKGYKYGPELKKFYRDIVEMQLGLNRKARAHFQIKLYETVQAVTREKIKKCPSTNLDRLKMIIFDPQIVLYELKKSTQ